MARQSPGGFIDPGPEPLEKYVSFRDAIEIRNSHSSELSTDTRISTSSPHAPLMTGETGEMVELNLPAGQRRPEPTKLEKLEMSVTWKDLGLYFWRQLLAQLQAVVPVSLYFAVFLAVVFRQFMTNVLPILGGLALVIVGLVFFLEGLKIFFMPLSERIGWKLPSRFSLPPVLCCVTVLGVLCTYAEPAINALVPLGELVAPYESPYLYWIMNPWRGWLVLSIGVGVGLSILLGTLRLRRNWKLNPMIYITLVFAIGPAIYLQWVNPNLRKLVPLAWDIGVVATGPVTVPITLALGNGIARSNAGSPGSSAKNPLAGFGLVALASLYPIITVQLLMLLLSFIHSRDDLLIEIEILLNQDQTSSSSIWSQSPYQELILALRAILPLAAMLLAILILAIREDLPELSWYQILKADQEAREEGHKEEEEEQEKKDEHEEHDTEANTIPHHSEKLARSLSRSAMSIKREKSDDKDDDKHEESDDSAEPPPRRRIDGDTEMERPGNRHISENQDDGSDSVSTHKEDDKDGEHGEEEENNDEEGELPYRGPRRDRRIVVGSDEEDQEAEESEGELPYMGRRDDDRGGLTDDEDDSDLHRRHYDEDGDHDGNEHGHGENEGDDELPKPAPGFFDSWRISIDVSRMHRENPPYPGYDGYDSSREYPTDTESGLDDSRITEDFSRPTSMDVSPRPSDEVQEPDYRETSKFGRFKQATIAMIRRNSVFLFGLMFVQIGCLLFNWGIVYGLSPLSLQVGGWLPTAYMHVNGIVASPMFTYAVGVLLILAFGFLLGALVTLAEPGMAVFCRQVSSLTNGEIDTPFLLVTVSAGVGVGLSIGLLTLVFHVPTLYIVLGGYPVAVLMTAMTNNVGLSAVAWDAAGTVTGPVTTPLVLSIGLAFGLKDPMVDGFGVLTCASIFPIISILLTKRVLELFTKLKGEARARPAQPGKVGVLGATLRWEEDEERRRSRRHRHRRRHHHHKRHDTDEADEAV